MVKPAVPDMEITRYGRDILLRAPGGIMDWRGIADLIQAGKKAGVERKQLEDHQQGPSAQ
jgi:hypothetical protein